MQQLQDPADLIGKFFVKHQLNYPEAIAFDIHGIVGLQKHEEVQDVVKISAREGGTCLTSIRYTGTTKKRQVTLTMVCLKETLRGNTMGKYLN